ncbi:MAG: tRNA lysidine(34) synthetase TilS [Bacteroidales bacterium]|nr:tRNA lysidine(34) synthetase TilS [Bacteroidales bacterium]
MQNRFDIALGRLSSNLGRRPAVLLAVSGGVDSMTMANLALASPVPERICVAHMNFSLRGEESDGDEAFVKQWCKERGVKFFSRKVDTQAYAGQHGISIEMAARELRYAWFNELLKDKGLDFVAVAHNLNDCAETMYLNILRGTGLRGISGIRPVNGNVIRPMLEFPRSEISRYALRNAIKFRMDSTNMESEYSRNRIRNEVFPQFEQINPSFLQAVATSMEHFAAAQEYIEAHLSEEEKLFLSEEDGVIKLDMEALRADRFRSYRMFDILSRYGFNAAQVKQIEESLNAGSGKRFSSPTHTLVRDRKTLNIYPLEADTEFTIEVDIMDKPEDFDPKAAPQGVLYVDADKLKLPLKCRAWQAADRFRPFGMKDFRKLSDFFSDLKLDVEQKKRQRIVTTLDADGTERIVCIARLRIDDRFKVTSATRRIAAIR